MAYLRVVDEEDAEPMELPTEDDGTMMLSTIQAQFPGCCGLKYRHPESKSIRGIRLIDERLHPPAEGWGETLYLCSFQNKRKNDDAEETKSAKMTRLEEKLSGSDLIVLGVAYGTNEETVREYFEQFGSLKVVQIKRDIQTGQSKGFAFIRFNSLESQLKVLSQRHFIDGRWCNVRIPSSKEGIVGELQPPSKLFIGRIAPSLTTADLEEYFSQFGQVVDVYIPKPHRSFGFVTFVDSEIARKLCGEDHLIKGVSVLVSNAAPKQNKQANQGPQGMNMPHGYNMQSNRVNPQQFGSNNFYNPNLNNYGMQGPMQYNYNNQSRGNSYDQPYENTSHNYNDAFSRRKNNDYDNNYNTDSDGFRDNTRNARHISYNNSSDYNMRKGPPNRNYLS